MQNKNVSCESDRETVRMGFDELDVYIRSQESIRSTGHLSVIEDAPLAAAGDEQSVGLDVLALYIAQRRTVLAPALGA